MSVSQDRLDSIVAEVVETHPVPATIDCLDRDTRRAVDRAAVAAGMSASAFWATVRGAADASRAARDDAREIARNTRRR